MNIFIQNRLRKLIDSNLPLIQSTINERVLPQIQGSIQDRKNQLYAFQVLYNTLESIPILNIITTFVSEGSFVEFCMPHASKYLGTNDLTDKEFDNIVDDPYLQIADTSIFPDIDKLFIADELLKLKELVDMDVITMDEFNNKKIKIIGMLG